MEQTRQLVYKVFYGPNINTAFASVSIQFTVPFTQALPLGTVKQTVSELLSSEFSNALASANDTVDFAALVGLVAVAIQDVAGPTGLAAQIDRFDDESARVSIGFHDADVAAAALQCGHDLAAAVHARLAGGTVNVTRLRTLFKRALDLSSVQQPDRNSVHMIRAAKARDIPVYSVAPGSRVWLYGYGARGIRFWQAIPQHESYVGAAVSGDKVWTQRLLQRAGFPGVQFGLAENLQAARAIARQLGYPLVTKPTDLSEGRGVTVGIGSDEELDAAFTQAQALSRSRIVQIEKFVPGNHYRLSVFGNKLMRTALFEPARIVGDGQGTVSALIKSENAVRAKESAAGQEVRQLAVDTAMIDLVRKQGFALDDHPPAGTRILLRLTSNIATGGRLQDVSDAVHPDNVELAEGAARILGVRGVELDLISPDIGVSWRETPCAIIDVNCPYRVTSASLAQKALSQEFAPGENGRIPCIVVVGADPLVVDKISEHLAARGLKVGRADSTLTSIDGHQRFAAQPGWPGRIMVLLLDPGCEVLVTSCTTADIEQFGLPHARFDLAFIVQPPAPSPEIDRLLEAHIKRRIEIDHESDIEGAIDSMINDRRQATLN